MNLIQSFFKKYEKLIAAFSIAIFLLCTILRLLSEYLLDPRLAGQIAFSSLLVLGVLYLFFRFGFKYQNTTIFFLVTIVILINISPKIADNFLRLQTASPFFIPDRKSLISSLKLNRIRINQLISQIEKLKNDRVIDRRYFQDTKILKEMNVLNFIFVNKFNNQIGLVIFKSKQKEITYLSTRLLEPSQESSCEKIETSRYLCYFDIEKN
jgi:hypothetical protein